MCDVESELVGLDEDEAIFFEPRSLLDQAIVGTVSQACGPTVVCYDYWKIVNAYASDGMSPEEATEFVDFNTVQAYVGPNTPMILFERSDPADE